MFVAMSRAKQYLYLTHPKPPADGKRSRFLEEVIDSQQPTESAQRRRTEFSSARLVLKRTTSADDAEALVRQTNWKCDDEEEVLRSDHDENEAEAEPAPVKKPKTQPQPTNAFALLMMSSKKR